ncbi:MAG: hypothetical protein O7G88_04995 [bacterium]|nr:hypothetical protein [bacterium]
MEEAAQEVAAALHTQFDESVVLARVYATVPVAELPEANHSFVRELVASAGAATNLRPTTPVLSLIGSHGQEAVWCDRRNSQGHVGIPLISADFVSAIPMIARLLHELGVPSDWVDSHDSDMLIKTIGRSTGLFYVERAADAVDHDGRKIIVADNSVSDYRVHSVFGLGAAYPSGQMLAIIVFCRDYVSRAAAECFLALTNLFVSQTTSLATEKKIFTGG